MSHFSSQSVEINDLQALIEALQAMGYQPEVTVDLAAIAKLKGEALSAYLDEKKARLTNYYQNDQDIAYGHVIVRNSQLTWTRGDQARADVGFLFDGQTVQVVIDDYESNRTNNAITLNRVKKEYAKVQVLRTAKKLGHAVVSVIETENGGYQVTVKPKVGAATPSLTSSAVRSRY